MSIQQKHAQKYSYTLNISSRGIRERMGRERKTERGRGGERETARERERQRERERERENKRHTRAPETIKPRGGRLFM